MENRSGLGGAAMRGVAASRRIHRIAAISAWLRSDVSSEGGRISTVFYAVAREIDDWTFHISEATNIAMKPMRQIG